MMFCSIKYVIFLRTTVECHETKCELNKAKLKNYPQRKCYCPVFLTHFGNIEVLLVLVLDVYGK